jgi:hypothetical protein
MISDCVTAQESHPSASAPRHQHFAISQAIPCRLLDRWWVTPGLTPPSSSDGPSGTRTELQQARDRTANLSALGLHVNRPIRTAARLIFGWSRGTKNSENGISSQPPHSYVSKPAKWHARMNSGKSLSHNCSFSSIDESQDGLLGRLELEQGKLLIPWIKLVYFVCFPSPEESKIMKLVLSVQDGHVWAASPGTALVGHGVSRALANKCQVDTTG